MPAKNTLWIGAVIVAVLALVPFVPGAIDSYGFSFLFFVFIYAILAQSWNLVAGFGGQISLGQHAFFGLGAYTTVILWSNNYLWGSLYDDHQLIYYFDPVTMVLSGIIPACAAVIIGMPLLSKLHGDYFALGTLGFGEIVRVILINGGDFTGGASGVYAPSSAFDTLMPHYWVGLGLTAGLALLIALAMKSRLGLALIAVRDDEMAASFTSGRTRSSTSTGCCCR
jgi:branched-chain amino acid transport system permease protein